MQLQDTLNEMYTEAVLEDIAMHGRETDRTMMMDLEDATKQKVLKDRVDRERHMNVRVPKSATLSQVSNALKPLFPTMNRKERRAAIKRAKRQINGKGKK